MEGGSEYPVLTEALFEGRNRSMCTRSGCSVPLLCRRRPFCRLFWVLMERIFWSLLVASLAKVCHPCESKLGCAVLPCSIAGSQLQEGREEGPHAIKHCKILRVGSSWLLTKVQKRWPHHMFVLALRLHRCS